jgi:hypothetical protein
MISCSLGDRVRCTATLCKVWDDIHHGVKWVEPPCHAFDGYFMGVRTVYEGTIDFGGPGEQSVLRRTRSVTHALVVTHLRKNPIRVPLNAITTAPPGATDFEVVTQ